MTPVPSPGAGLSQESPAAWDRRTWLVAIPLALIVAAAFIPSLDNGFVAWDDDKNFVENPYFRGLGAAQVQWAWTTFLAAVYQPLAWMLFEVQYVFWQLEPRGYHLTSVLFQVVNAVVLYVLTVVLLVRCRTDSRWESPWTCSYSAGLATALFMVHPLRAETVAWASCQPYLPCALFSMLAVLAYLRAFPMNSSPRWGWLVGSFLLFVAALLCKAVAVSLPAVLLILDVYPLRRFGDGTGRWLGAAARRALWEKAPFVMVSLVFMGLAIAARAQSPFPIEHSDVSEGIAQACYAIWFYIGKTVLPLDLAAMYPLPKELDWLAPPYSLSILATLALTAVLFLLRRRWPGLLAAWLCYLVILAPNSGIIRNNSIVIAADRYSYMSMLGLVMVVAACFCRFWRMSWRWNPALAAGTIAMGSAALLILLPMTRSQCRTWLNSETLWTHALSHGANSSVDAHDNLGVVLSTQGKYPEAEAHFLMALRLEPGNFKAHYNLGTALYLERKYADAEPHFAEAVRLNPGYVKAHYNRGLLHAAQGKYEAAVADYTEALRLDPGYADAHFNLGNVLSTQGKVEAAVAHYTEALRLDPGNVAGHNSLGTILSRQRRYREAEAQYALAMRLRPGDPKAYNDRAMIMAACPEATFRDGKKAIEFATRACELTAWKNPIALDTLAAAQAEAADFDAAISTSKRAIELLTDERLIADYRSRLALYQAKKPYRHVSAQLAPTEARP